MDWEYVEKQYGLKIYDAEKIRNIYKLETDRGIKCFKKAHTSPNYFLFVFSAIEHLIQRGFIGTIPYDRTVDGDICLSEDEYIYYMHPWVEGRQCRFKKKEELKSAIKTAACLHIASEGFIPPETSKPRIHYGKWPERFNKRCSEMMLFKQIIEEKSQIDVFDEVYYTLIEYYLNQGYEAIELLKNSPYWDVSRESEKKGQFCHHDMAEHNFLITTEENMKIIDFDFCIMDTRLHDVASLVIRNMKRGIWDIEKAYFILNEYSKYYPINDRDLKVIKYFMTFPQDFWQIGLQYYVEKQPWTMEVFLSRLDTIKNDKDIRHSFIQKFLT